MAINFPSTPTNGQIHVEGGVKYAYDSSLGAWTTVVPSIVANTQNKQIIFNDAGTANGSNSLTFDKTSNTIFFASNTIFNFNNNVYVQHRNFPFPTIAFRTPNQINANGGFFLGHYDIGIGDSQRYIYSVLELNGNTSYSDGFTVLKSRGNSINSLIIQTNDEIGIYDFRGYDGTRYISAARISGQVDGTPGIGDMPGRLVFSTTSDGTSSLVDRMKIHANGDVFVIGNFYANSKQFVITHPSDPSKKLHHGSLEGPEHAVFVRGMLVGESMIHLPHYWKDLIDSSTITVHLTSYGSKQDIWVTHTTNSYVQLNCPANCYYTVYAERKDIPKLQVEV
jgi:hypothetical protein